MAKHPLTSLGHKKKIWKKTRPNLHGSIYSWSWYRSRSADELGGGWAAEDKAGGNYGGGREGGEADGDYLYEILRAIGQEMILKNVKSLENLERVKKQQRRVCMVLKRVVRHTGWCYVLYLSCPSSSRLSTFGRTLVSITIVSLVMVAAAAKTIASFNMAISSSH